jgi:hypothetical protein
MNVSVDKLLQPHASYSRTGKMTEAMSSSSIRIKSNTKPSGIDFSKSLAANELGHNDEPADEAFLCSSPRLHPSVALKSDYVSRQEMERAFRLSVKSVFEARCGSDSNSSHHQAKSSKSHVPLMTPADWKAMKAALREANRKKAPQPSSAFLAVSRGKVGGGPNTGSNPPVGHYRPKFHIVEESAPGVKICKPITNSPSKSPRGRHRVPSPQPSARPPAAAALIDVTLRDANASPASPLGDVPAFSPGGQQRTGASSPTNLAASISGGKTQFSGSQGAAAASGAAGVGNRALTPSWPFASASPGHVLQVNRSWSVEPDPTRKVNAALVERRSGGSKANLNLALAPGRRNINDAVNLKDVFYNANPFANSHTPTYKFSVAPGRSRATGLPRTAADVPRATPVQSTAPDLDVSKYKRQPVLVDFARSTQMQQTRRLAANGSSGGGATNSPSRSGSYAMTEGAGSDDAEDGGGTRSPQRIASPDFRKYLSRPQLKHAVSTDLLYDVTYQGLDRHVPAAFIKEPVVNHHVKPAGLVDNHHNAVYHPSDVSLHPSVVRNIAFDAYVTREKRDRSGREGTVKLNEAQHKFYNTDVVGVNGSGGGGLSNMAQQVSRDQRAELLSPKRACVDTVYDGSSTEGLLPGLRRGMVEMDKMVDREKRSHSSMR